MTATLYLLALALLTDAAGAPLPRIAPEDWPAIRVAVFSLAVDWEILDERETRLTRFEDLARDVNELRQRRQDLAGAPRLADASRLPNRTASEDRLQFNRAYRHALEQRLLTQSDRANDVHAALRETDRLNRVWEAVRDARCDIYYVPVRRSALQRLRELVGDEAYVTNRLPPHVPVWRFFEVK